MAILNGIFSVFGLVFMFFLNIQLAIIVLILISISLLITILINKFKINEERMQVKTRASLNNYLYQIIRGIKKIRISGAEKRMFILWGAKFYKMVKHSFNASYISNFLTYFNIIYFLSGFLFMFLTISIEKIPISMSTFIAFNAVFIQIMQAIIAFNSAVSTLVTLEVFCEPLKPILLEYPEVNEHQDNPGELKGSIRVENLSFQYFSKGKLVLNNLSFQVTPGEFVALVGYSGSGKSTIFRLLLGLEKYDLGTIYYDGKDLSKLNIQSVRRQIGTVIQNSKLMSGSIFTNITGNSKATFQEVLDAIKIVHLEEEISQLPMQLNTNISDESETISGGMKQKILLAHAIVNKPRILLLDEASSVMDNITQEIISKNFDKLSSTRLIISQRLNTIKQADRILVINQGQIVEQGTYYQLMKIKGFFSHLVARQLVN